MEKMKMIQKLFVSFILVISTNIVYAKDAAVVNSKWLQENIDKDDIVLIDLRDEQSYLKGHIKQAVNIDALEKLFGKNYMMPGLEELKEIFSSAGIGNDSHAVLYDNGDFIWAARMYWLLETLGHTKVSMLNVGYGNWKEGTFEIATQKKVVQPKEFVPQVDNTKLQTKLGTLVSIGKKTIIDGRKKSHYLGKESTAKRKGHIPTAQNYACTQNYEVTQSGNKMRDFNELKDVYKELPKDKEIILYCDGGAEAALNYVVLQELGYDVSVYDGSWVEWGNDPAVPIEQPLK